jgi:hypothetical protein
MLAKFSHLLQKQFCMSDDGDDDDDAFQHKLQVLISGVSWSFFAEELY